jgi:hypothetical protein
MIKGIVTVKKYNLNNDLIWEHTQENIITEFCYKSNYFLSAATQNSSVFVSRSDLYVSDQNTVPIYNGSLAGNLKKEDQRISNLFYPLESPPFGEIVSRLNPPGTPRTINSIGLKDNNETTNTFCYTQLTIPCIQGQFEFVDIYYRIQFSGSAGINYANNKAYLDFAGYFFNLSRDFRLDSTFTGFTKYPFLSYTNLSIDNAILIYDNSSYGIISFKGTTPISTYYKSKWIISGNYNFGTGKIFSTLLHGKSSDNKTCYDYTPYEQNRIIQNGFWQKSTSTVPFFDANNFGSSQGIINLIDDTWTAKFPDMFRIEFGTTGNTGVATYKFKTRKFLGFTGNNYTDIAINSPYRNYQESAIAGLHGWDLTKCIDILRYSDTQIVQYDTTGVTLLDVYTGDFTTWDAVTTPALPVTSLRQVAIDITNSKIYCACRDTGLYEIDVIGNTVTNLVSTNCYGVDVGTKIWAMFNGSLRNSDNWAVTVPFTFVGISNGNWDKTQFLKADPIHADHRIGIIREVTTGNYGVVWFDSTLINGVTGYNGSQIREFPGSVDICDTSDFWATFGIKLNYGNATTQSLSSQPSLAITHTVFGSITSYKIDFYGNFLICSSSIVNSSNVSQNSYTALTDTGTNLHLINGITVLSKYMRCLFTDNTYIWQSYGWDGANWTLGSTNYKTTHTSEDILINGLKIKFTDGAIGVQFNNTEHFIINACYGLLKDSATTIYYEKAYYTQELIKIALTPIVISGTSMNLSDYQGDTNALIIEGDSPQIHTLTINGVLVFNVYVNGFFPEPGAVTIDVNTGVISFNPVDVGKTLAGDYYYLSR